MLSKIAIIVLGLQLLFPKFLSFEKRSEKVVEFFKASSCLFCFFPVYINATVYTYISQGIR